MSTTHRTSHTYNLYDLVARIIAGQRWSVHQVTAEIVIAGRIAGINPLY